MGCDLSWSWDLSGCLDRIFRAETEADTGYKANGLAAEPDICETQDTGHESVMESESSLTRIVQAGDDEHESESGRYGYSILYTVSSVNDFDSHHSHTPELKDMGGSSVGSPVYEDVLVYQDVNRHVRRKIEV